MTCTYFNQCVVQRYKPAIDGDFMDIYHGIDIQQLGRNIEDRFGIPFAIISIMLGIAVGIAPSMNHTERGIYDVKTSKFSPHSNLT